tara:strand:+ start:1355 stop:1768 length:414 start_codon:yes stop_codon:yes gene_type:complete
MNKFFVPDNIYEDRIAICKSCEFYFKPTGNCKICKCFMSLKARLAPLSCPKLFWNKTTAVKEPKDLPQHLIDEVIEIHSGLIRGRFKNHEVKKKAIDLYNTIYMTNYSPTTNCGSCLSTCFDGIRNLYKKYTNYYEK